ncbi:phage tail protein [Candidatus Pacearchaeota archaeon]|nr:phage tail protein [Candidatus Pacearchaeota archaeon]
MGVPLGAVARVIGIETDFVNLRGGVLFLPQRVAVVAQGNTLASYATTPLQVLSRKQAGDTYGYGSPIERIVNELLPANGDGVGIIPVTIYPLEDDGSGVAADGAIGAVGTQTTQQVYTIKINEVATSQITIPATTAADAALGLFKTAIDAVIEMPLIGGTVAAGSLPLDCKWKGLTGNDIFIEIEGTEDGIVFTITQPVNGAANPDVDDALNQIGDVWETIIVNQMGYDDSTSLDKYATFNEGRWLPLIYKPLVVYTGHVQTEATIVAVTDLRKTDRTNIFEPAPGSNEFPWAIAGRAAARSALIANNNPPQDYAGQTLTGIVPGAAGVQWNYTERNDAVSKGASTVELVNSVLEMSDTITAYHPDGEVPPAYQYHADIVKLSNIIFNISVIFAADEWKGAPLLANVTPTTNPTAKKPKDAVSAMAKMVDALALEAILSDPETAKGTIVAAIDSQNPKRTNVGLTVQIAGNTNIISVDLSWGFFFGV